MSCPPQLPLLRRRKSRPSPLLCRLRIPLGPGVALVVAPSPDISGAVPDADDSHEGLVASLINNDLRLIDCRTERV